MNVFIIISGLENTEHGPHLSALRKLSERCLTMVAHFGAEMSWHKQKAQSIPLQRLENQAMGKIVAVFRTILVVTLEAELGQPPVNIWLQCKEKLYATRLLTMSEDYLILGTCANRSARYWTMNGKT
jgi:hypothetical protein